MSNPYVSRAPQKCHECGKKLERCILAAERSDGTGKEWVCRRCWKALDYDSFMHKYKEWKEKNG